MDNRNFNQDKNIAIIMEKNGIALRSKGKNYVKAQYFSTKDHIYKGTWKFNIFYKKNVG